MQLIDMRHLYRLQLLIFVGLVLYVYVQCQTICKKDQYTVVKLDGSKTCLNCDTCHAGWGLDPPCGSRIPYPPKIDCVTCPDGKFSDKLDSAPCHSCQRCAEHEIVTAPCTNQSNRICNGTCEAGYFYSKKDSTHSCKKCSYCCLDGKDEEIPECANQGLEASKQHCHPRPAKDCNPDSSVISPTTQKTGNDTSTDGSFITGGVIGGVFGGVSFIVTIGIALCCLCLLRRKKGMDFPDAQQSSKVEEENGKESYTLQENGNVSQDAASVHSPTTGSTPQPSAVAKQPYTNQGLASSKPGTPCGTPQLQKGHNSHTSGAQENGNVSQDAASVHSPTTGSTPQPSAVAKHPCTNREFASSNPGTPYGTAQLQKGHNSHTSLAQENGNVSQDAASVHSPTTGSTPQPSAVTLHPCTNRGFASSNPGTPYGTPKLQKGHNSHTSGEYKCLREIDMNTQGRIESLLTQKLHGLGGWREIASKYGMDRLDIKSLENDREAGRKTLEFLGSSKPDLTVYDFCETLKEHNIRRLDIVKELEN